VKLLRKTRYWTGGSYLGVTSPQTDPSAFWFLRIAVVTAEVLLFLRPGLWGNRIVRAVVGHHQTVVFAHVLGVPNPIV
jgi:hypothetical protein